MPPSQLTASIIGKPQKGEIVMELATKTAGNSNQIEFHQEGPDKIGKKRRKNPMFNYPEDQE
jgi:hypothetical protein